MTNKKVASEIAVGIILIIAIVIGGIFWLQSKKDAINNQEVQKPENKSVAIANPASVFCEKNGGKSEIVNKQDGNQSGNCVFDNGSKCEEWAYFKGECKPGATGQQLACTMDAKLCADGKTYVSRTAPNCEFAPCPVVRNDILIKKSSDNKFSIDNIEFSLPIGWSVVREEAGKIYIKDLNYKSKYDVFLFPSRITKGVMGGSTEFDKSGTPIKINGGEIFSEAIGGAFAGYVVDIAGYEYEIIWDITSNELPPADNDGIWAPSHGFATDNILEIMKTAHIK